MDRDAFALMADSERDHWWFRGRRDFIERAIAQCTKAVPLPVSPNVLDAGCGSGGNLGLLARWAQGGTLFGFEYDAEACAAAQRAGLGTIASGSLPDGIPFGDTSFDLIGLFDVLEHLEHPVESLRALRGRLNEQGALVLTVPALQWLWGPHDEVHNHYRRYSAPTLRAHLESAGFAVEYLSYMNLLLLPLAIAQRFKERLFGYQVEALTPSPAVNSLLYNTWRLERAWIPQRTLPLGLSLLAVARPAR
ncbi:MAG TPA: class I SAM-dependent methyltransferase [Gemmatimonas sp.]|uniref:class I SAM-dependent methyltransferase n=1 Tax=Gemmatimonas sp. TaxID=1962908 RepID=UPI002ED8D532